MVISEIVQGAVLALQAANSNSDSGIIYSPQSIARSNFREPLGIGLPFSITPLTPQKKKKKN